MKNHIQNKITDIQEAYAEKHAKLVEQQRQAVIEIIDTALGKALSNVTGFYGQNRKITIEFNLDIFDGHIQPETRALLDELCFRYEKHGKMVADYEW